MSVSGERGAVLCIIGSGGKGWETDYMATYVISDIHGKYVKFMELLDGIGLNRRNIILGRKGETYELCDNGRHTRYL